MGGALATRASSSRTEITPTSPKDGVDGENTPILHDQYTTIVGSKTAQTVLNRPTEALQ